MGVFVGNANAALVVNLRALVRYANVLLMCRPLMALVVLRISGRLMAIVTRPLMSMAA